MPAVYYRHPFVRNRRNGMAGAGGEDRAGEGGGGAVMSRPIPSPTLDLLRAAAHQPMLEHEEEARLADALRETPRGAFALSGAAVALLLMCWFAIYVFVFLPRGGVG